MKTNKVIKVKKIKSCLLCKEKGTVLYKEIPDRFFNIPGLWNIFQCPSCKLVWLSPRPVSEDIQRVYKEYYTHSDIIFEKPTLRNTLRKKIKTSLVAANFSYKENLKIPYSKWMRAFFKLTLLFKIFGERTAMYLQKSKGDKLLDVGCGNGELIAIMKDLGWEVIGVEPDRKAADFVQKKFGIKIFNQTFEKAKLPLNFFEAVIMRHVIEHTEDPVEFLKKAWNILKPGGKLVVVTPNIKSLGHLIFKRSWLHLDPPRHLFLFSSETFLQCAKIGGLKNLKIRIVPATGELTYIASRNIQKKGKVKTSTGLNSHIVGAIFQLLEIFLAFFRPSLGEEIVLEAVKEK